jgi:hypothetical protein
MFKNLWHFAHWKNYIIQKVKPGIKIFLRDVIFERPLKKFKFLNFKFNSGFYFIQISGSYSVYFNVTHLEASKSITLETNSYFLFQSSFDVSFYEVENNCALMQIEHHFNIGSMLFQNTFGDILRKLLHERFQRALYNLKLMLSNVREERIFVI